MSGSWATEAPMPTPRYELGTAVIDGTLYAVGGNDYPGHFPGLSTLEAYDPQTDTWTTKAPMPTPRYALNAEAINGVLYAVGGYDGGTPPQTLEAYDPQTDTWTEKTHIPIPRLRFASGVINGILYVVGGYVTNTVSFFGLPTSSVEAYDPQTNTWTAKASLPAGRAELAAGVINGVLYAVGGTDGYGNISTLEAYDPVTNTWTTKAPMPTPRSEPTVAVINGKLYVVGGTGADQPVSTVEAYDPVTDSWSTAASMPTPRTALAAGVVSGVLYAVGGFSNGGSLATNEAFTPAPTTLIVTTASDAVSHAGTSLRDAIAQANADAAAGSSDTITFDLAQMGTGTITLTQGQLELTAGSGTITIDGGGQITVSGNHTSRVLRIASGATDTVTGLTIANGTADAGGGIWNAGTLTVSNSMLSGNLAPNPYYWLGGGGIYNEGRVMVSNSTFSGNTAYYGGAIRNQGTMTVADSDVSGNTANYSGGGLYSGGALTVSHSTLSSNTSHGGGGGIMMWGGTVVINDSILSGNTDPYFGGGIYNYMGTLTINNSTLSGNSAAGRDTYQGGGGMQIEAGNVSVINSSICNNTSYYGAGGVVVGGTNEIGLSTVLISDSTIVGNSSQYAGGIFNINSGVTLQNTIIAGNTGVGDFVGNVNSLGHNLLGDTTGSSGWVASDLLNVDPLLGPLADNGGPTPTMALLPGSPAIDAGTSSGAPTSDQRGAPRDAHPDIGAFEVAHQFIVTTTVDEDDGTVDPTVGTGTSLREAIAFANANPGADTIGFAPSLAGLTITLAQGQLELTAGSGTTTIDGGGQITVSGGGQSRVFLVPAGAGLDLSGLSIIHGFTSDAAGAILTSGDLTIEHCTLADNHAGAARFDGMGDVGGGGIVVNGGTVSIGDSRLSGNTADGSGGGMVILTGTVSVSGTTLSHNATVHSGAAIINSGTLTIRDSTLSDNVAGFGGGGIYHRYPPDVNSGVAPTLSISNTTLFGNICYTPDGGGAIFLDSGTLFLRDSTISGNSDPNGSGGGIFIYNEREVHALSLQNTIIAGNTAGPGAAPDFGQSDRATGVVTSLGHNLIGNSCGTSGWLSSDLLDVDPRLGPLTDNGGPTQTMALLPGSPAIDAGSNELAVGPDGQPLLYDQRGPLFPRVVGASVDIGALEFVSPHAPVADAGGPYSVAEGDTVLLDATGTTDPDLPSDTLTYAWDFDGDGQYNDATGIQPDFSAAALDGPATQTVLLRVVDQAGNSATESAEIHVQNVPPTISGVTNSGPVDEGSPVTVTMVATDPAGAADPLTYEWDFDNDGTYDASGSSNTASHVYADHGTYTVAVRVRDDDGGETTASTSVTIYHNAPLASFAAVPNPCACNQTVGFDAASSTHGRPDRTIVRYEWDFDTNGTYDWSSPSPTATHSYGRFGLYTVTLRVTDDNVPAKMDTATLVVDVSLGNLAPVAEAGGPYLIEAGQDLQLTGSGSSDPNTGCGDTIVSYAWDVDNDGQFDDAAGKQVTVPWTQLAALPVNTPLTAALQVTDSLGLTHVDTATLTIHVNRAPTDIALDRYWVPETIPGSVVGRVTVTDPDVGDSHTFVVSDNRFEVAHGRLQLKSGISLNRANEPTVTLDVTAIDLEGLSVTKAVVIAVLDPSGVAVTWRLDFNGFHAYTEPNWIGVPPWQLKTSSRPFGWLTLPPQYFERNAPETPPYSSEQGKLRFDGQATDNMGTPLTFEIEVKAGETYELTILTGDSLWSHDNQQFSVSDPNGSPATPPSQIISTRGAGGEDYRTIHFTTAPIQPQAPGSAAGKIHVTMQDLGGADPAAVILGMDIRPTEAGELITFARTGPTPLAPDPLAADGVSLDTYSGTNAPPDTVLTIMAEAGANPTRYLTVTPDLYPWLVGTQVRSGANGSFSFHVQRPTLVDPALITVEEFMGASRGTLTQTYQPPETAKPIRFDFGVSGSPLQTDFVAVVPQTIYNATKGYGWMNRVAGVDRRDPNMSALRTDLNYAKDATFKVNLDPSKTYNIRIYHANPKYNGTVSYVADNFRVYAEGVEKYSVASVPAGGSVIGVIDNLTVSADGILDLRFQDFGGQDGSFVVSGIEISAGALPGEQPLLAEGDPRDGTATGVDMSQLQPLVAEASARWDASGLTAEDAAALSQVRFAIEDLGGAYLGLANTATKVVRIDDDAAGLGWSLVGRRSSVIGDRWSVTDYRSPITDYRLPDTGIDLLTVLMHELGHVLGYGDEDPLRAGDSLMAGVLTPGARRTLPTRGGMGSVAGALADGTRSVPATVAFFADLGVAGERQATARLSAVNEPDWESGLLGMLAQGPSSQGVLGPSMPLDGRLLAARPARRAGKREFRGFGDHGAQPDANRGTWDAWFADLAGEDEESAEGGLQSKT